MTQAKREDLYPAPALNVEKKDNTVAGEKREELYGPNQDLYSAALLRKIDERESTGAEEKREELYSTAEQVYRVSLLRAIGKEENTGAEKREELYGPSLDLYSKLTLAAKEE